MSAVRVRTCVRWTLPNPNLKYKGKRPCNKGLLSYLGGNTVKLSDYSDRVVLLDGEADTAKKYMVSYLPTNYIINRRGEISAMHIGLMEYDGMEDYIEAAFKE